MKKHYHHFKQKYMKKILLLFVVLYMKCPRIFGQESNESYKYEYKMTINSDMTIENANSIPIKTIINLCLITNQKYSLLKLSLASINSPIELSQNSQTEDSFFIDNINFLQYSLSDKCYSQYDTISLSKKIKILGNHNFVQELNDIQFFECDTLPKFVKPFSQYIGNCYGVTKIVKSNSTIELITIEKYRNFDFTYYLCRIKDFPKSNIRYEIPFK